MIHTRRYVNKAKYAPKMTDCLKPLDVVELLKKEINRGNISFEIVSEATGTLAVNRQFKNANGEKETDFITEKIPELAEEK